MPAVDRTAPERVLLVRLSHLGDVVHALPAFRALRRRWPAAELGWAVQSEFAPLLDGLPGLDRRFVFERHGGLAGWWRLRRAFARWRPDLALDVQGNAKSAAVSLVSGARRRLGPAPSDWREPFAARWLHASAPPCPADVRHAVDRVRHVAAWAVGAPGVAADLDLGLGADERAAGRERLTAALGAAPAPLLFQLGRVGDPRSLDPGLSARLIAAATDAGRAILVLAGPLERGLGVELARRLPPLAERRAHLTDALDLRGTAALMAAVAERGGVFVGADSGPLHLAAAVGLRSVSPVGPQDPDRTGAWPPASRNASPHRVVWAVDRPECAPCLARRCAHPEGPVCTGRIDPARILAAAGPLGD